MVWSVWCMEQLRGSCWNYEDAGARNPSRRLSPTRLASLAGESWDAADWLPHLLLDFQRQALPIDAYFLCLTLAHSFFSIHPYTLQANLSLQATFCAHDIHQTPWACTTMYNNLKDHTLWQSSNTTYVVACLQNLPVRLGVMFHQRTVIRTLVEAMNQTIDLPNNQEI